MKYFYLLLLMGCSIGSNAQENEEVSNVQAYTPSVLLNKGQIEVSNFNNLYTQTATRDERREKVNVDGRQTFLTSNLQFSYGLSNTSRVNLGWDILLNSAYYDPKSGALISIFTPESGTLNRTVLSAMGPRVKVVPFSKLTKLSVQSSFLFPVAKDLESPFFTAHDRYTWNTQFFYDQVLSDKFRLFLETDFLYRIKRNSNQSNFFRTPITMIVSYFSTANSTLYVLMQHAPAFGKYNKGVNKEFGQIRWYSQIGVGGKYQFTQRLGAELSYTNFVASKLDGAGQTFNLGVRYLY